MKTAPLFGARTAGKSLTATAQRRVNVYTELSLDSDKSKVQFYGTPGLSSFLTHASPTPNGPNRGTRTATDYFYVVAGDTLFKYTNAGVLDTAFTGVMVTSAGECSLSDNGTELILVDGTSGYICTNFNSSGGTLSVIADADFPQTAKTVTFLGGYFIVDDPTNPGRFYKSASYDGTTWETLDFATAEQNPDPLIACDADHGALMLFGARSIEFWQNTGALDFPLSPILGATQQWGLAARFSRAHLNNTTFFLAQNLQGQVQVMKLNGYVPQRVSDFDIENIINQFSTVSDAVAYGYLLDGHAFYQITFPTAGRSFLFDATMEVWSETASGATASTRHLGQHALVINGKTYITDYQNPYLYRLDSSVYTDAGTTIKRILQTRHTFQDSNVIGVDEIHLSMETGVGLQSGQGSDPEIIMQVSQDGGRTFGPERFKKFGKVGEYRSIPPVWRRCGSGRDFVFRFAMTDPVKFAVTGGAMTVRYRDQ